MSLPFDQIVLCTHNPKKRKELLELLADLPIKVLTPADFPGLLEPVEDGDTFVANARIKARAAFEHTGLPSLADDSGLVVSALNGEPGVYSARYAGVEGKERDRANRDHLRNKIQSLSTDERKASFHCTLVFQTQSDTDVVFVGTCDGELIEEDRGEHGFGYDPMFFIPELNKTFAEIDAQEKAKRSHRGHALTQFVSWLKGLQREN